MKLEIWWQFLNNIQIYSLTEIRPVGTELYDTDRRTDMTELIVAFSQFYGRTK